MKIQTLSIVAGNSKCDSRCPFCVSKMTPYPNETPQPNYRNFHTACKFAIRSGVTTAMITGKGEPTLFPNQITMYLKMLDDYGFPFIELQTNGINLWKTDGFQEYLIQWKEFGLTTISLSCVHFEWSKNKEIYGDNYPNLGEFVSSLQHKGFSIRLGCTMIKGVIDSVVSIHSFVEWAKQLNEQVQLTFRPVTIPKNEPDNNEVCKWTKANQVSAENLQDIQATFEISATPLLNLAHGAIVYDYHGQNVCITNCLTRSTNTDEVRQLIYFPDGRLRYDWEYMGAILL